MDDKLAPKHYFVNYESIIFCTTYTLACYKSMLYLMDKNNVYQKIDDEVLCYWIHKHLENKYTGIKQHRVKQVLDDIKTRSHPKGTETLVTPPLDEVVFADCILDPVTQKTRPIQPDNYISSTLPYTLDEVQAETKTPNMFFGVLDHLCYKYQDKEAIRKTLQQFM